MLAATDIDSMWSLYKSSAPTLAWFLTPAHGLSEPCAAIRHLAHTNHMLGGLVGAQLCRLAQALNEL